MDKILSPDSRMVLSHHFGHKFEQRKALLEPDKISTVYIKSLCSRAEVFCNEDKVKAILATAVEPVFSNNSLKTL